MRDIQLVWVVSDERQTLSVFTDEASALALMFSQIALFKSPADATWHGQSSNARAAYPWHSVLCLHSSFYDGGIHTWHVTQRPIFNGPSVHERNPWNGDAK